MGVLWDLMSQAKCDIGDQYFRVILVDNFDRDNVPDQELYSIDGESVECSGLTMEQAKEIADRYNSRHGDYYPWYAKVVSMNYKLRTLSDLY